MSDDPVAAPMSRAAVSDLLIRPIASHDHGALVAIDPTTGAGVGVARYVRSVEDRAAPSWPSRSSTSGRVVPSGGA